MSALRDRRALALLRVTVAALLCVHGAARNGMEYGVLLVICLLLLA